MGNFTHLTKIEELFINAPQIPSKNYYKTDNGVSAKSWYPCDNKVVSDDDCHNEDVNVTLYSTGLCKLNYSVNALKKAFNWRVRILDKFKNELLSFEFAPMVIEGSNKNSARQFKLERRFMEIDDSLINSSTFIQLVNLDN